MKLKKWGGLLLLFFLLFMPVTLVAETGVTTERDDKGVWFISGDESAAIYDVFEAMGYAVATDRLWQAETFRRMARGRLAEILGDDFLQQDQLARITGYSDAELTAAYENLDLETKDMIDGYVAGFNRRILEIDYSSWERPFEFRALEQKLGLEDPFIPSEWTVEDVLAWQAAMLRQFDPEAIGPTRLGQINNAALLGYLTHVFGQEEGMIMFNDLRWSSDPDATTYIPDSAADPATTRHILPIQSKVPTGISVSEDLTDIALKMEQMWRAREKKLKEINALPEMGSYAWVLSGEKTATGLPTIYAGPQMGFDTPAICLEGSIDAAGIRVSGMAIPGLPGIVIGRTPHHAWSMQVGHARTVDYYFEPAPAQAPDGYYQSREETIHVAGLEDPITIQVYRTPNGPVIMPGLFDPDTYVADPRNPIISWKYAHWDIELDTISAFLALTRAESMDEFGTALENVGVSQHFCYADRNGNIAYWMSGLDPVRPDVNADGLPVDWRFPQGFFADAGIAPAYWSADNRKPLSTDRNTGQGFYAGWNNRTSPDYSNSYNNLSYIFGPFHRAHVLEEYLSANDNLSFEEIRDLALYVATTDSFGNGGNPWTFVKNDFTAAVQADATGDREEALAIMDEFDGHFVDGGPEQWVDGMDRADGWLLAEAWILEVLRLTFVDELGGAGTEYDSDNGKLKNTQVMFNVLLRTLDDKSSYDWFQNRLDENAPQTADEIIVAALDSVLAGQLPLDARPWGAQARGQIEFNHRIFNAPPLDLNPLHTIPFSSRSTYAHCVEMAEDGQSRVMSMFPLGQSGTILPDASGQPDFDEHFFSMTAVFDDFSHRDFPLLKDVEDKKKSSSTCFVNSLRQQ